MSLLLYSHPLASFCHKVLIALYESGTPFQAVMVDSSNPGEHAQFLDLWPVGKMPVLRDQARDRTVPESTIILEYLDQHYPGAKPLLPTDPETLLDARLWDRFFDQYVHDPMQRIVANQLRPTDQRDPLAVSDAEQKLLMAYAMIDKRMANREWVVSDGFSIADCAAVPALFYGSILLPFGPQQPALHRYFERLIALPSVRRVLVEAQPYYQYFPFRDRMPERFLTMTLTD